MEEATDKKPQKKTNTKLKPQLVWLLMFLLGALTIVAVRFAAIKDTSVHYHADFVLYVNGQKDEFKSFTFYEEVQSCSADDANNVKDNAHMHDNKAGLVHVHAAGVTWGQFFSNLGYTVGDNVIETDEGVFADGQDGNKLTFMLNGQEVDAIANRVVGNTDRLLINYGKEDKAELQTYHNALPNEANKANTQNDPAACSGGHKLTFADRLKQAIGLGH